MAEQINKTYISWKDLNKKRNQVEYTHPTQLLDTDGNLLVRGGWARHNVFEYDRTFAHPQWRGKEWDFYQLCNGKYMVQISIANISIGGYASATLVDVSGQEQKLITSMTVWLGGKNKVILPENCDRPNIAEYKKGKYLFRATTLKNSRTLEFVGPAKDKMIEAKFQMDMFDDHQNITIVTPFKKKGEYLPKRFFMTMKQNCMPCEGTFKYGNEEYSFEKKNTFCVLDWGRGVWPYKNVWYWGNGAQYITDIQITRCRI